MKKNRVIQRNNLPTKLPILESALCFTILHYWHAPECLWVLFGLDFVITWGAVIWARHNEEKIDLLNNDEK